jgi:O-antigen ligase
MFNTTTQPKTMLQIILLLQIIVFYFVVISANITSLSDLEAVTQAMRLSLLFQGTIGCLQFGLGRNFLLFSSGPGAGETITVDGQGDEAILRAFGTVGKPNAFGDTVGQLLLINLALLTVSKRRMFPDLLSILVGVGALVFSFSRGAWISTTVAMMIYLLILARRHRQLFVRAFLISSPIVAAVGVFLLPYIQQRFRADDHNAAESRVPLLSMAWSMFEDYPVFGAGGNTYKNIMYHYVPKDSGKLYVDQVHNMYLLVLAECGLVGFLAFVAFLFRMFRDALFCMRSGNSALLGAVALAVLLALVEAAVHMNFEAFATKMDMSTLVMYGAILAAGKRLAARRGRGESC